MPDNKYGRLFTKADMREAILFAYDRGRAGEIVSWDDGFVADVLARIRLTFPSDEPLFLLRGQDKAAPRAIADDDVGDADYLQAARAAGANPEHLRAVEQAAQAMREWQATHPDRVKVPD